MEENASLVTRSMDTKLTDYGFVFGPMEVTRCVADEKLGYYLEIKTDHEILQVHVTPKGRKMKASKVVKRLR